MKKKLISLIMAVVLSTSMLMLVGCNGFDLSKYKEQKKTEIKTYATSKGEENYYEAEWQEILSIVESAKTEIDVLEDKNAVDAKVTLVKEVIDNVITKEQLLTYKAQAKTELENYAVAKGEENYNEMAWGEINSIVESTKTEIDAVLAKNLVDEKVTIAKERIDGMLTNEQLEEYKTAAILEIDEYHKEVYSNAVPYVNYVECVESRIIKIKKTIMESNTKEEVEILKKEIKDYIATYRESNGLYREIDVAYKDGALTFEDLKDISYYYNEAMGEPGVKIYDETQKKYVEIKHTPRPKVELDYYTELFMIIEIGASNYIYLGTYNDNIVFYAKREFIGGVYIKGYSIGVYLSGYFADGMGIYVYSK